MKVTVLRSISLCAFIAVAAVLLASTALPVQANHLECSDGTDNDNDGTADFPQDPECSSTEDDSESDGAQQASASSVVRSSASTASVAFDLSITDNQLVTTPLSELSYSITATNRSATAQTVDVILTTSQFVDVSMVTPTTAADSSIIVWRAVTFAPAETKTFTYKATVRGSAPEFASVNSQVKIGTATAVDSTSVQTRASSASSSRSSSASSIAFISSSSSSSSLSSASSVQSTTSQSSSSVQRYSLFTKTAHANEVMVGTTIRYTLTVQNVLLATMDDARVTDSFDASILSVAQAGGGESIGPGQLQWTLPVLRPGQTWTTSYVLNVSPAAAGKTQLSNVANLSGGDVAYAPLNERVVTVQTAIMQQLPSTGAPYDVLFVLLTLPLAAAPAWMYKRTIRQ